MSFYERMIGGAIPLVSFKRERYRHHCNGGEQTRTLSITWLRRCLEVTYGSNWKARL